ncbi:acyl-CoA dehydrogenase family protein, partial [Bradyrhizobium uaiense]|uniref:acyl-CoA dehydrogenase family protein n=1 Tax=Bradyrhizobium uaiense TaxID=2594946 RepID=UPI003D31BC14
MQHLGRQRLDHRDLAQAFGGPLWNQQGVRLKLAQLAAKAAAARALAYQAAELAAAGK